MHRVHILRPAVDIDTTDTLDAVTVTRDATSGMAMHPVKMLNCACPPRLCVACKLLLPQTR